MWEWESYRLMRLPPEQVYAWLEENCLGRVGIETRERTNLEVKLYGRSEPLVNLGLALFGTSSRVGETLYMEQCREIQLAALHGTTITSGPIMDSWVNIMMPTLVEAWDSEKWEALLTNPYLPDHLFMMILERTGPMEALREPDWFELIRFLYGHPRFNEPAAAGDILMRYQHEKVPNAAWDLVGELPVSRENACRLLRLTSGLPKCTVSKFEVEAMVDRWKDPVDVEPDGENAFEELRANIATWLPDETERGESPDRAVRRGHYRTTSRITRGWIDQAIERDGEFACLELVRNPVMYRTYERRERLERACYDISSDLGLHSEFKAFESKFRGEHPHWFILSREEMNNRLLVRADDIDDRAQRFERKIDETREVVDQCMESQNRLTMIEEATLRVSEQQLSCHLLIAVAFLVGGAVGFLAGIW